MPAREHPRAKLADGVEGPSATGHQEPLPPENGVVADGVVAEAEKLYGAALSVWQYVEGSPEVAYIGDEIDRLGDALVRFKKARWE